MDSIITREQSAALDNLKIKAINPMQESAIVHCRYNNVAGSFPAVVNEMKQLLQAEKDKKTE